MKKLLCGKCNQMADVGVANDCLNQSIMWYKYFSVSPDFRRCKCRVHNVTCQCQQQQADP